MSITYEIREVKAADVPNITPSKKCFFRTLKCTYYIIYRDANITVFIDDLIKKVLYVSTNEFNTGHIKLGKCNEVLRVYNVIDSNQDFDLYEKEEREVMPVEIKYLYYFIHSEQYFVVMESKYTSEEYKIIFRNSQITVLIDKNDKFIMFKTEEFDDDKFFKKNKYVTVKVYHKKNKSINVLRQSMNEEKQNIGECVMQKEKVISPNKTYVGKNHLDENKLSSTILEKNSKEKDYYRSENNHGNEIQHQDLNFINLNYEEHKIKFSEIPNIIPKQKHSIWLKGRSFTYKYYIVYRDANITVLVDNKIKEILCVDSRELNKNPLKIGKSNYKIESYNIFNLEEYFDLKGNVDEDIVSEDIKEIPYFMPIEDYYVVLENKSKKDEYRVLFKNSQIVVLMDLKNRCSMLDTEKSHKDTFIFKGQYVNSTAFHRKNVDNLKDDKMKTKGNIRLEELVENKKKRCELVLDKNVVSNFVEIQGCNIGMILPVKSYLVFLNKVKCKLIYKDEYVCILLSENNKTLSIPTSQFESNYFEKDEQRIQLKIFQEKEKKIEKDKHETKVKMNVDDISQIAEELFKSLDQLIEI
jgi:hypothetical protein